MLLTEKTTKKNHLISILSASILSVSLLSASMASAHQPTQLERAISSDVRSDKNKARDSFRHPEATLEFFGFKSTMTVVEITPGGGWYTEILAPALKGTGKLYGAHYPDTGEDNYYSNSRKRLEKTLAGSAIFSEVELTDFIPKKESALAPKSSADLVLTFRNLHNWGEEGIAQVFKDAYTALKDGGVLGVVEHRMPATQDWEANKQSGYVPTAMVVKLAKEAGFVLGESSEINANAKDNANHPKGVWTLPPRLRLGEKDKEKYLAIGESDRMTLKFIKPAHK